MKSGEEKARNELARRIGKSRTGKNVDAPVITWILLRDRLRLRAEIKPGDLKIVVNSLRFGSNYRCSTVDKPRAVLNVEQTASGDIIYLDVSAGVQTTSWKTVEAWFSALSIYNIRPTATRELSGLSLTVVDRLGS